jgi:hypothetical protein
VLHCINELIADEKHGVSGKNLLKYAGHIPLDALKAMSEAIERKNTSAVGRITVL